MRKAFDHRRKAVPRLIPQRRKIVEAILLLIEEAARLGVKLTQYDLVKSIFIADDEHLNTYGRPITFDNFVAMQFGPVPSESYDMLKPDYPWMERLGIAEAPFRRVHAGGRAYHYVEPQRSPDLRVLSRSDANALRAALAQVKELGFGRVKDLTHKHPAYVAAWRDNEGEAFEMDYNKMLRDGADADLVGSLVDASRHMN